MLTDTTPPQNHRFVPLNSMADFSLQFWGHGAAAAQRKNAGTPLEPDPDQQGTRHSSAMRHLQDTDAPRPVFVATPRELEAAILQGRLHIVITAHLDMTSMPLRPTSICLEGCESPLPIIQDALSIRGECDGPPGELDLAVLDRTPGAAQLLPFQDRQCLIMTNGELLPIMSYRIWLDNLYLRAVHYKALQPRQSQFTSLAAFTTLNPPLTGEGAYYATRTTFQSDGLGPTVGIWSDERSYIENCTFANLGGDDSGSAACGDCTGGVVAAGSFVHIVNSTFFDPVRRPLTSYVRAWGSGGVLLTGCTFAAPPDITRPLFYARESAVIYTDDPAVRVRSGAGGTATASPVSLVPDLPADSNRSFLQRSDPWFVNIMRSQREIVSPQPAYPAPLEPVPLLEAGDGVARMPNAPLTGPPPGSTPPAETNTGSGLTQAATIAIAMSITVALLLLVVATTAFVMRQRRRRQRRGAANLNEGAAFAGRSAGRRSGGEAGRDVFAEGMPGMLSSEHSAEVMPVKLRSVMSMLSHHTTSTSGGRSMCPVEQSTYWATTVDFDGPLPTAAAPAGSNCKLDALHAQLNSISSDVAVLERFSLLGPNQRRQGGQGVVAFARGVRDELGYALKFFIDRASFLAERDMYRSTTLGTLLPQVHAEYDPEATPGALLDGAGRPLPPCIVMERGEGLPDWSKRAKPDVFQSVAVLAHVATRLRDMHEGGYVHRDIKPENLMFLPRENRWTVIDFGCTVAAGDVAPLAYTLVYASPETAAAVAAGAKTIVADPAADAWALGVVAFELLTGQSAFNLVTEGRDSVLDKLLGQAELAWEGELAERNPVARRRLGLFREPVLSLLRRDPAQRATLAAFCRTVNTVFSSPTTIEQP